MTVTLGAPNALIAVIAVSAMFCNSILVDIFYFSKLYTAQRKYQAPVNTTSDRLKPHDPDLLRFNLTCRLNVFNTKV